MEARTMRRAATLEVITLHNALEAFTNTGSGNIDKISVSKLINLEGVTNIQIQFNIKSKLIEVFKHAMTSFGAMS